MTSKYELAYNQTESRSLLGELVMSGSIRCNQCGMAFDERRGVCPKCGRAQCHISLYWQGKRHKIYRDQNGIILSFMTAADQLLAMSRAMREKKFKPQQWLPENAHERKIKNVLYLWLADKEKELVAGELSPGTLHCYRSYTKIYYIPFFGSLDIQQADHHSLDKFKENLPNTIRIKTKRNIINAFHAFLTWARRADYIDVIPPFPIVRGNDAIPRTAITLSEQRIGLDKLSEEYRDVFEFEFETGIRPGETCALKVKDISIPFSAVLIQRTFSMGKLKENTKGNNKKLIPLSDRAFEIISKNIKGKFGEEFIFVNPKTQKHYTVKLLNQLWQKYSGIKCTHYEASRHSFATQIVESCEDIKAAQSLLRHADLRSTMQYVHGRLERLREITNKRSKVVSLRTLQK